MRTVAKIFFLLVFGAPCLYAQHQHCDTATFQSRYWFETQNGQSLAKLIAEPDGNIFLVDNVYDTGQYKRDFGDVSLTKLTSKGTVLWSRQIGYMGSVDAANDAKGTSDGGFIISGSTQAASNPNGDPWLLKLDANGMVQWSWAFSPRAGVISGDLRNAVQLKDGGFAAVGEISLNYDANSYYKRGGIFVRLNKNGEIIWSKILLTDRDFTYFSTIKELHDGNLALIGGAHNTNTSAAHPYNDVGYVAKFGIENGNLIWSNILGEDEIFANLDEKSDNSIRVTWRNFIRYFNVDGTNTLNTEYSLSNDYLSDIERIHLPGQLPGEDYYLIMRVPNPVLIKVVNDAAVDWARIYSYTGAPGLIDGYADQDAVLANNGFYLRSTISANYYPDSTYLSNQLPYIIKTNAEGITPCSDTFPNSFTFTNLDLLPDKPVSFTEWLPAATEFPAPMYSKPLVPHGLIDCADITCCRDTVMYNKAMICEGTSYKLPGGTSTDTAGVFIATSKKANSICDSIIFTSVKVQKNIKVSLGNDTCLPNLQEIKYHLSYPGRVDYLWNDGSTDSSFTVASPGQYWVRVTSLCNTSSDSVTVFKECNFPLEVPDAFTPNGDGVNDLFRIADMRGQQLISFGIYNRFGQLIFFTTKPSDGWNGKFNGILQSSGAYIYLIRYNDKGSNVHEMKGAVVLIR